MKKLLYGSTALLAAGMLASAAQAADKIKVGVGGYFQAYGFYIDEDDGVGEPGANRRDHGITREAEIIFNGKTTLDNGLEVGVQVQLEAETCADQIDESFLWFEGGWGRINLGSENSAPYLMQYAAPAAILGFGPNSPNHRIPQPGSNRATIAPSTLQNMTSDSEKLTYFTPRIAGFQLGLSYTPENCEEIGFGIASATGNTCGGSYGGARPDNDVGQFSEVFEIGANYVQKFGDFNVALSGGYGTSDLEASPAGVNLDDRRQFSLGFNIGWGGFTVGGAWLDDDDAPLTGNFAAATLPGIDVTDWNIGVRYVTGPWGVGVNYAYKEVDLGAGGGEDELNMIEVGSSYALGPGIDLTGGVQWWNWDSEQAAGPARTAAENEALVFIVGTTLSF